MRETTIKRKKKEEEGSGGNVEHKTQRVGEQPTK